MQLIILMIFLNVTALRPVMCSFMLICQCCFAIVKVLLKIVTYLLTYKVEKHWVQSTDTFSL